MGDRLDNIENFSLECYVDKKYDEMLKNKAGSV